MNIPDDIGDKESRRTYMITSLVCVCEVEYGRKEEDPKRLEVVEMEDVKM